MIYWFATRCCCANDKAFRPRFPISVLGQFDPFIYPKTCTAAIESMPPSSSWSANQICLLTGFFPLPLCGYWFPPVKLTILPYFGLGLVCSMGSRWVKWRSVCVFCSITKPSVLLISLTEPISPCQQPSSAVCVTLHSPAVYVWRTLLYLNDPNVLPSVLSIRREGGGVIYSYSTGPCPFPSPRSIRWMDKQYSWATFNPFECYWSHPHNAEEFVLGKGLFYRPGLPRLLNRISGC